MDYQDKRAPAQREELAATNINTRNGPDAITWQSKDRTLDGKALFVPAFEAEPHLELARWPALQLLAPGAAMEVGPGNSKPKMSKQSRH